MWTKYNNNFAFIFFSLMCMPCILCIEMEICIIFSHLFFHWKKDFKKSGLYCFGLKIFHKKRLFSSHQLLKSNWWPVQIYAVILHSKTPTEPRVIVFFSWNFLYFCCCLTTLSSVLFLTQRRVRAFFFCLILQKLFSPIYWLFHSSVTVKWKILNFPSPFRLRRSVCISILSQLVFLCNVCFYVI